MKPLEIALSLALSVGLLGFVLPNIATAATIPLAQVPAANSNKPPSPNMIISVDDSGSMGAIGMANLRSALTQAFSPVNLPDDTVRIAWQTMNGACRTIPSNIGLCGNKNTMDSLSGQHRLDFNAWVATLAVAGSTPTHQMVLNAGRYMSLGLGINNPWASNPGTTELPYLGCRKAYHVLMTDGGWNSFFTGINNYFSGGQAATPFVSGNADGTGGTLPDGTVYAPNTSQTRYIGDTFGTVSTPTLSDMVFAHWATDLQSGIPNQVEPLIKEQGTTNVGATALSQYWNPKNDPATWQHLVTYTLGFNGAAAWPIDNATVPIFGTNTYDGDYPALINATKTWYNPLIVNEDRRAQELWHMALNSRGEFVPAVGNGVQNLVDAFNRIIKTIVTDTSQPLTSISATGSSLATNFDVFEAGYNATNWTGKVVALPVSKTTGAIGSIPKWNSATQLDALTAAQIDARLVLTHSGLAPTPFRYANLSVVQQTALRGTGKAAVGTERVNYIRGDQSLELSAGPYRKRSSRQGDIVNSSVWYTGEPLSSDLSAAYQAFRTTYKNRTPIVYVGGNDGMLHGFDATLDTIVGGVPVTSANAGKERLAYVPQGLVTQLNPLTDPSYTHRYYVDGNPFTGDIQVNGNWGTYLVSGLGGGGKGYFVLNVTNPAGFTEANAATIVVTDKTATLDPDIGYIYAQPVQDPTLAARTRQIVKLNDGGGYVVMGNGYNSTNERAALIAQKLTDTNPTIVPVELTLGQANGLAAPLLIDINGDKKPDIAYAGDLKGRIWKFDLRSNAPLGWTVAFGGQPLFTATVGGVPQPITTAPTWKPHPDGGIMLSFGTGRNLTVADRTDTQTQSVYSVRDDTPITISPITNQITFGTGSFNLTRSSLVQQTLTASGTSYITSTFAVPYSGGSAKFGWFVDLPAGMRTSSNANDNIGPNFAIRTIVPGVGGSSVESCDPVSTGKNYYFVFNSFLANTSKSPYIGGATGVNGVLTGSGSGVVVCDATRCTVVQPGENDGTGAILPPKLPPPDQDSRKNPGYAGWREIP